MGRDQSPRRSLWVRATRETQYYLVTCPPRAVEGHWDAGMRRMRRCGHDLCQFCNLGWERRQFWYVGLFDMDGQICVTELREAQAELRRSLLNASWDCVGTQLAIYKDGPANNSPVRMIITGAQRCEPNDIAALVSTLGLPPVFREYLDVEPRGTGAEPRPDAHQGVQGGAMSNRSEGSASNGRRRPDWGRYRDAM